MKNPIKIATFALGVCAVLYLCIPLVAGAQSLGPDAYNHTRVAPQFVSPDGGRVQGKASAEGYQYVSVVSTTADGGMAAPLLDGDKRTVVSTGVITGSCLGADLTTTSAAGPTIPAGAEYRLCALTDLWIRYDGEAATADAPSEPIFARTCIVRGPYGAQRTTTAILGAGGQVLAGKELVACPVTRPQ